MEAFVGRTKDLKKLNDSLEKNDVVCITGEPGVGKSSLAHKLYSQISDIDFDKKDAIDITFLKSWEEIIIKLALSLGELSSRYSLNEIENAVKKSIFEKKVFFSLDNVDNLAEEIKVFIEEFVEKNKNGSKLLITLINSPFQKTQYPNKFFEYVLKGFTEDEHTIKKHLLGDSVCKIINDNNMWPRLENLKGNPYKLKYLKLGRPGNQEDLKELISHMEKGEFNEEAIKEKLKDIKEDNPICHFIALGRIRALEVSKKLLAFLWDRLSYGNTWLYFQSLERLSKRGFLSIHEPGKIRIDRLVHKMLRKFSEEHFGNKTNKHIDYFISEYYRNSFLESKQEIVNLKDLDHYVFHAIQLGNYDSVYTFVFESDILNKAHIREMAFELQNILHNFYYCWSKRLENEKDCDNGDKSRLAEQWLMIQIELGRVYKDLSRHDDSIKTFITANNLLKGQFSIRIKEHIKRELQRKIWHYLGIVYSQTGSTKKCIEHYSYVIKDSAMYKIFDPLDALSLGYLSYELKFRDMHLAEKVGEAALELCDKINNPDVNAIKVKNLCSLGLIRAFMHNEEKSKEDFKNAKKLCKNIHDDRELIRILVNSAVAYIYSKDWVNVNTCLDEAFSLYKDHGDKRRKAMGIAYQGIMLFRRRFHDKGKEKTLESFQQHQEIRAIREMIYEALTYIWMVNPDLADGLTEIITSGKDKTALEDYLEKNKNGDIPTEMYDCIRRVMDTDLLTFVDFWVNYYKPTLLLESTKKTHRLTQNEG